MLTKEMNQKLTQVGRGTPTGELLRRYWMPFSPAAELQDRATKKVRLLGEDLALFRDLSGQLGLVAENCPHRRCSLAYGVPEAEGIRCPYHGWLFDNRGNCLEQPAESQDSLFKDRVKTTAYPVKEMGGLYWAYMGPGEPPILPRYDYFVQPDTLRSIGLTTLPINWLQAMENSLDPTHLEWLHAWWTHYMRTGESHRDDGAFPQARHAKIGFDVFDFGIIKRRIYEGGSEEDLAWSVGHPILFPNILKVGSSFQIRVPVDDETTLHMLYHTHHYDGVPAPAQEVVPSYDFPYLKENGEFMIDVTLQQDMMAWVTQGRIADRSAEHVGASDRGVLILRQLLDEQIAVVEAGGDPLGTLRDPSDDVQLNIPVETMMGEDEWLKRADPEAFEKSLRNGQLRWSPILDEVVALYKAALQSRTAA